MQLCNFSFYYGTTLVPDRSETEQNQNLNLQQHDAPYLYQPVPAPIWRLCESSDIDGKKRIDVLMQPSACFSCYYAIDRKMNHHRVNL
jgi:hypothetical protein